MTEFIYAPENHSDGLEEVLLPSRTYRIKNGRIRGYIDHDAAMLQAIEKILRTDRMSWLIYSWQYGHDLHQLIGKEEAYIQQEAERMIKEALMADERVLRVHTLALERISRGVTSVRIAVETIYGDLITESEVLL